MTPAALLLACALAAPGDAEAAGPVARVRIETTAGAFEIALDREHAPRHAAAFVARACGDGPFPLVGSVVCRKQPGGYVAFGCEPPEDSHQAPRPPAGIARVAPEIDAVRLGLTSRTIDDPVFADRLWQEQIVPRWRAQQAAGRVDPRLDALMNALRDRRPGEPDPLLGRPLAAVYEALGFVYREGLAAAPVERGAVADATLDPEGGDGRFLVALMPMPARDGRATVFGRVAAGLDVVEAISRLPTTKTRAPAVRVLAVICLPRAP